MSQTTQQQEATVMSADSAAKLSNAIADAINEFGDSVVAFAFIAFLQPLLPFVREMHKEQELIAAAKAAGIDREQALDGIALMGHLLASADPHRAWLAGEIYGRTVKDAEQLRACIGQGPKQ